MRRALRYALQGLAKTLPCLGSAGGAHLRPAPAIFAAAFEPRAHKGAVACTLDQISPKVRESGDPRSSVLAHGRRMFGIWPHRSIPRVRGLRVLLAWPKQPISCLGNSPRSSRYRPVDRFVRHPVARCVGETSYPYPGDLLRRAARTKQRLHCFPQRGIVKLSVTRGFFGHTWRC